MTFENEALAARALVYESPVVACRAQHCRCEAFGQSHRALQDSPLVCQTGACTRVDIMKEQSI